MKLLKKLLSITLSVGLFGGLMFAAWNKISPSEIVAKAFKLTTNGTLTGPVYFEASGGLVTAPNLQDGSGNKYITGGALSGYLTGTDWTKSGAIIYNNNTGNVGIGTGTPISKLEIYGRSLITTKTSLITTGGTGGTANDGAFYAYVEGKDPFVAGFEQKDTQTGAIQYTNVVRHSLMSGYQVAAGFGVGYAFQIQNNSGNMVHAGRIATIVTDPSVTGLDTDMNFTVVRDGVRYEGMRINSQRYVGIGTTLPTVPLDVNGIINIGTSDYYAIGGSRSLSATTSELKLGSTVISKDIGFYNGVSSPAMFLSSGGKLGLGTIAPISLLTAYLSGQTRGTIASFGNATDGSYGDIITYATPYRMAIMPTALVNLVLGSNGSEKVRIDTTGNVGIGTTSPTQKLTVNGNIKITSGTIYDPAGNPYLTGGGGDMSAYVLLSGDQTLTGQFTINNLGKGNIPALSINGMGSFCNTYSGHIVSPGFCDIQGGYGVEVSPSFGWGVFGYVDTGVAGEFQVNNGIGVEAVEGGAGADGMAINASSVNGIGAKIVSVLGTGLVVQGGKISLDVIGDQRTSGTGTFGKLCLGASCITSRPTGSGSTDMSGYMLLSGDQTIRGNNLFYDGVELRGSMGLTSSSAIGRLGYFSPGQLTVTDNSTTYLYFSTLSVGVTKDLLYYFDRVNQIYKPSSLEQSGTNILLSGSLNVNGTGTFDKLCLGVSCITSRPTSIWTTTGNFSYYTGNIAIGINTGSETLTVSGTMFITSWVYLSTGSRIGMSGNNMSFQMYTGGNRIEKMWITP